MRLILVIGLVVVGYLLTVPCILHVMVSMMMCGQLFSCPEDARWKLNYYGEEGSVRGESFPAEQWYMLLQSQAVRESFNQLQALSAQYPLATKSNLQSSINVDDEDDVIPRSKVDKPRVWSSDGPGWDVFLQLTSWPTQPAVSNIDWAMRWELVTKCLSVEEPDDQDMFDIDMLAHQAFWNRVFACYLPYAQGTDAWPLPRRIRENVSV